MSAKRNGKKSASRKRAPTPRSATGKKMDPRTLAAAEQEARDWLRQRTEEGHLAAGRLPPSQQADGRRAGAAEVRIDQSIRTLPVTEDEKLLQSGSRPDDFTRTDPWRVMRLIGGV